MKSFNPFKYFEESVIDFILELLNIASELSSSVCLIGGLVGVILYIFGWEKGKKAPLLFWGIHLLIKIIGGVLIGL